MKCFADIVQEIMTLNRERQETIFAMDDCAREERQRFRFNFKTDKERAEYMKTHLKAKEELDKKYMQLCELELAQKLKMKFLNHNARCALRNENLATIVDVWNQFKGKRYGEKTKEKITTIVAAQTGCNMWLKSGCMAITYYNYNFACPDVTSYLCDGKAFLVDNVIQEISMDDFQHEQEYIDDIDNRLKELQSAFQIVTEKERELQTAYNHFNALAVDGMKHFSFRQPRARLD